MDAWVCPLTISESRWACGSGLWGPTESFSLGDLGAMNDLAPLVATEGNLISLQVPRHLGGKKTERRDGVEEPLAPDSPGGNLLVVTPGWGPTWKDLMVNPLHGPVWGQGVCTMDNSSTSQSVVGPDQHRRKRQGP